MPNEVLLKELQHLASLLNKAAFIFIEPSSKPQKKEG